MLKLLNFRYDKRTLYNILKFPLIIFVRVPVTLFFWGIEWINDWSEVIHDKLPGWKTE